MKICSVDYGVEKILEGTSYGGMRRLQYFRQNVVDLVAGALEVMSRILRKFFLFSYENKCVGQMNTNLFNI